jgi:hypothetical protein
MKISAVISYVNCNDPQWLESYRSHVGEFNNTFNNCISRFRDTGTLKLCIDSIVKFAPYINDIYIIVSSPSQIPNWLDTNKYHIIYHSDFIPKEYLPLFSSCALETWFGNLPNYIGEKFIYFNDDMILTSPTNEQTFFDKNNNPIIGINIWDTDSVQRHVDRIRTNCYNLVMGTNINREVVPQHGPAPYRLSWCKEFFSINKEKLLQIYNPLTRDNNCISQYAYMFYQMMFHNIINKPIEGKSFYNKNTYMKLLYGILHLNDYVWVCLNDYDNFDMSPVIEYVDNYINGDIKKNLKFESIVRIPSTGKFVLKNI